MNVFIDADACPVVNIILQQCKKHHTHCVIVCDTAHQIHTEYAKTIIVDKCADSADYMIANRIDPGDLVVTQDYGLASMCLTRGARVLHQDGWEYTENNIDALLLQRHESLKYRMSGGRIKGPKKRTEAQNKSFSQALQTILQG